MGAMTWEETNIQVTRAALRNAPRTSSELEEPGGEGGDHYQDNDDMDKAHGEVRQYASRTDKGDDTSSQQGDILDQQEKDEGHDHGKSIGERPGQEGPAPGLFYG
jgi:hypothetical protein